MKKLILICLAFLLHFHCQAQTEKGSLHIGLGGIPIIYPEQNNWSVVGYSMRANIGYFVTDRLSIGLMPFIGNVNEIKSQGASINLRYFLLSNRTKVFLEAGAGLGRVQYENSTYLNGAMNSFTIGPGINHMLNDKISIELILQYARLQNITFPENTYILNYFIPTIGIQYYIKK